MTPRDPRPVTSRTFRGPLARGWLLRHASPLAWVVHSGPLMHPTLWSRDRQEALGQSSHCDAGLDCHRRVDRVLLGCCVHRRKSHRAERGR